MVKKYSNKNQLRRVIRKIILEHEDVFKALSDSSKYNFVSHSFEPIVGDKIINNNPNCKHYRSEGVVLSIDSLADDVGKTVEYQCTNDGDNWASGDVLVKTMDQLAPA